MSNEERKVNKLLIKVKYNAYKLKESGSLPLFLYRKIVLLGFDSSMELVKAYIELSEKYLRIKGFYGKYPEIEFEYEQEVNKFLKERGFD